MDESLNLLSQTLTPFFGKVILFIVSVAIIAVGVGLIVGIFTYGSPSQKQQKRSKKTSLLEDILDMSFAIGTLLSHKIMGSVSGKSNSTETWMDDQRLISSLKAMKPSEFEAFIAQVYTKLDYATVVTGGRGDGGIDVQMVKDGRTYLIQCKKFITQHVAPNHIREFLGAMTKSGIDGNGIFITTHYFTTQARLEAEDQPIELIDGRELVKIIRKSGVIPPVKNLHIPARPQAMNCPKCGNNLTLRHNKANGQSFYGCSNYPKCRYTKEA